MLNEYTVLVFDDKVASTLYKTVIPLSILFGRRIFWLFCHC